MINIFLKFFAKQEYTPLFESIKEIFDPRKNFYKSNNITNLNQKISIEQFNKKRISGDYYNVYYLNVYNSQFYFLRKNMASLSSKFIYIYRPI